MYIKGGAILAFTGSHMELTSVHFSSNAASDLGADMYLGGITTRLINCTFNGTAVNNKVRAPPVRAM